MLAVYLYNPAAFLFATISTLLGEPKTYSERCGRDRSTLTLLGTLPRYLNQTVCSLVTIVTELPACSAAQPPRKSEVTLRNLWQCLWDEDRQTKWGCRKFYLSTEHIQFSPCQLALFVYPDRGLSVLYPQLKGKCQGMPRKDGDGPHSSQLGDKF